MFNCKNCEGKTDIILFVPFENPRYKDVRDPRYSFHLKQICANCHKFAAFVTQTPETMKRLHSNAFIKLDINPIERDKRQLTID